MLKKYLRNKFINWLVKDLFSPINDNDILKITGTGVFFRGKKLNEEAVDDLKNDAERFANSAIWKLLSDDAIYQANFIMYSHSKDYDGMIFGKVMLYCVDILKKKIQQIVSLK